MGGALSQCHSLLGVQDNNEEVHGLGRSTGPQLALRVTASPITASSGAMLLPIDPGQELKVVSIERAMAWEPLRMRFEQSMQDRAASSGGHATQQGQGSSRSSLYGGPRSSMARRFYRVKVVASDGRGGLIDQWCLLQVANHPNNRSMDNLKLDINDASDAVALAGRFNTHVARVLTEQDASAVDPDAVPTVKVCAPLACFVVGSAAPDVAVTGDAVLLTLYPFPEVHKFVYDGSEEFQELSQAFFHYAAWSSDGRQLVCDLQGVEDDSGVVLVDPVVLRAAQPGIGALLGTVAPGTAKGQALEDTSPSAERFDRMHPRCGQLCKSFDPHRRTAVMRRHCGLSVPTCGIGGA
mmetsp:Transcript_43226/g.94200  ORF Transcript_43226/g.94200 Transcript_43226/m.94200 type:complete len:352 (+) Transcript_43226:69-1124(+)